MDPQTEPQQSSENSIAQAPVEAVSPQLQAGAPLALHSSTVGNKRRFTLGPKMGVAGIIVVLCVLTASLSYKLYNANKISAWDAEAATNSAAELSADVSAVNLSLKNMEAALTVAAYSTASNTLTEKISDAQKQYNILRASPILTDSKTASAFTSVKAEWQPYTQFILDTSTDYKTLGPLLIDLSNAQESSLAFSQQSNNNLATELNQYQSIITSTGNKAASLKMLSSPDQQLLSALKTYVNTSNSSIAQAKTDLSKDKGTSVPTEDFTAITAAATTFSQAQDSYAASTASLVEKYDPSSNIAAFITALGELSIQIGQPASVPNP